MQLHLADSVIIMHCFRNVNPYFYYCVVYVLQEMELLFADIMMICIVSEIINPAAYFYYRAVNLFSEMELLFADIMLICVVSKRMMKQHLADIVLLMYSIRNNKSNCIFLLLCRLLLEMELTL